jgi:putative zinc finger/helix-turn-helix YgiT family protein
MMRCPECGGRIERSPTSTDIAIGRRRVSLEGTWDHCVECGEVLFAPGEMDEAMRRASAIIRQRDGMLAPHEIVAIRQSFGLTQADFERLLDVGAKTVVRWERGTVVPNGATNTLLRLLRDVPEAAAYLTQQPPRPVAPSHTVTYRYESGPQLVQVPLVARPTRKGRRRSSMFRVVREGVA